MEDIENSGQISIGSGIIVKTFDKEQFIGTLMGADEDFMYIKVSHQWGDTEPKVHPDSLEKLARLMEARPMWLLRIQAAKRMRLLPIGLTKEDLVELLSEDTQQKAIESYGPVQSFIPKLKAENKGISLTNIAEFTSLADVMSGTILSGLDFHPVLEDNELDDNDNDNDNDNEDAEDEELPGTDSDRDGA